jgi:hypothetical protein
MKSFETEIKKYAEKTRLKAVERETVRDRILSYMEYHPLKKERIEVGVLSELQRRDFIYIPFNTFWVKIGSGAFALMLLVGVPFLAERSVPGDVLYLVKTEVTEGIRTQLASTPFEKVELETKLMERRIAEARLLASEGKLTTEVEAKIAETVKDHAQAVQSGLAELRIDDADGAALAEIVFNSALEVQSAVLDQSDVASSSSVGSILEVVNTMRDEVASGGNPTTPSYDGLLARIESETTRSYEYFTTVKKSATAEEITDIERRLADIDRSIVTAKALKETDETGAVGQMMEVLGLIQKLITFMTDIDVRETVALETLVPLIHTPEERIALVTATMTDVSAAILIIERKLGLIIDEGILDKAMAGVDGVHTNENEVTEALLKGNIELGEAKTREARAKADDLLKLTAGILLIEDTVATTTGAVLGGETSTTTDALASTTESILEETAIE